jgi:hypothetical protein
MESFYRLLQRSVLCLTVTGGMSAAMAQAMPGKPVPYRDAQEGYRSFIEKAKQAEAIKNPLKRCLAYPDYPGNRWPAGLAAAYCHFAFDHYVG